MFAKKNEENLEENLLNLLEKLNEKTEKILAGTQSESATDTPKESFLSKAELPLQEEQEEIDSLDLDELTKLTFDTSSRLDESLSEEVSEKTKRNDSQDDMRQKNKEQMPHYNTKKTSDQVELIIKGKKIKVSTQGESLIVDLPNGTRVILPL